MHSVNDGNSYWVMPRCPVYVLIIKRGVLESGACRNQEHWPISDFDAIMKSLISCFYQNGYYVYNFIAILINFVAL